MKINLLSAPVVVPPYGWLVYMDLRKLGVHERDGWCMQLDERIVFFDSEEKCVPLGPILEIGWAEFSEFLSRAQILLPSHADLISSFPKALLLKHIFHSSVSAYWPEKALGWLEADKGLQKMFKSELQNFAENTANPQQARQRAKRILRSISQPSSKIE